MNCGIYIFLIVIQCALCENFRFDNYSLYRITVKNDINRGVLEELKNTEAELDFWNDPAPDKSYVLVMTKPSHKEMLERLLIKNGIEFEVTIPNIQDHTEKETRGEYTRNGNRNMTWDRYYSLQSINAWLYDLAQLYPGVVSTIIGGISYENRPIRGIKISHGPGRRAVFIEGGMHSREWIGISTVNFIIKELLTSDDDEIKAAARDVDWYIFPVTNPDGYIWSYEHFRLWRKNRRPKGRAFGVDLNRNWNHKFLLHGASIEPTSDLYAGPGPFSEPETRTLSSYIRSISSQIDIYLSFHSFGQLLLVPFGNTTDPLANYHEAVGIGKRAMGALSIRHNTWYQTGNIAETIYLATGGSIDWVKDKLNIPLVYCYELRDNGTYGFLLPEEQILPNNLEVMDSLVELLHQAKRFGYLARTNSGNRLNEPLLMMIIVILLSAILK